MASLASSFTQNLPEMLAWDLAEQRNVFQAKSIKTGSPVVRLISKTQPPNVPKRNPSRVAATRRLHTASPPTGLCSLNSRNMESAWRDEGESALKGSATPHALFRAQENLHLSSAKDCPMKQEHNKDERRVFLDGLDEDWSSNSSADVEGGVLSSSVRTRQQSITTAATSVDAHPIIEGRVLGGCGSVAGSLERQAALFAGSEGESWVDLDPELGNADQYGQRAFETSMASVDLVRGGYAELTVYGMGRETAGQDQQALVCLPRGRSSLSHQVVVLDKTAHTCKNATTNLSEELALQQLQSSAQNSLGHHFYRKASQDASDGSDPSRTPVESTGLWHPAFEPHFHHKEVQPDHLESPKLIAAGRPGRQPSLNNPHIDFPEEDRDQLPLPPLSLLETSYWYKHQEALEQVGPPDPRQPLDNPHLGSLRTHRDQLFLPPLNGDKTTHNDDELSATRLQQQHPNLLSKPRKSQSATRMPLLSSIHSWLENQPRSPPLSPASPMNMSSNANNVHVRVSIEVLDNVRVSVVNFPDTMLLTSSYTVEIIRSYLRKVKRNDVTPERISAEQSPAAVESPVSPKMRSMGRKASLGNLKLMNSLRGKLTSRFGHSPTSTSFIENGEKPWPPTQGRDPAARSNVRPSLTGHTLHETREVMLRKIFPQGTNYLLDALYAHLLVYNYIDSVCNGHPHLHQNVDTPDLRTKPTKNFVLPPGVTSLADLQCQPDVSATVIADFKDDIKHIRSKSVVPTKAAATLGIGSTNMGKPVKPEPSSLRGSDVKLGKAPPRDSPRSHSLESDSAMQDLRGDVARNIYRLVETVEACPSPASKPSEEDECDVIDAMDGKELPAVQMRLLSELVRLNEELTV